MSVRSDRDSPRRQSRSGIDRIRVAEHVLRRSDRGSEYLGHDIPHGNGALSACVSADARLARPTDSDDIPVRCTIFQRDDLGAFPGGFTGVRSADCSFPVQQTKQNLSLTDSSSGIRKHTHTYTVFEMKFAVEIVISPNLRHRVRNEIAIRVSYESIPPRHVRNEI